MDLQPTLEGPRLLLRPLRAEDFEDLYAAASDPRIWEAHPERDRWKRPVFEAFFQKGLAGGAAFAVVDKAKGEIVGTSRYYDWDPAAKTVAIGFTFLTRAYWGGDYNRELKKLMLDHAFKFAEKVLFHVGERNLRSRRAMEKIGGVLAGRLDRVRPDGRPDPTVVYEIRRPSL
jgi:RimJ/RimL family protein N-acetyltransferase